MNELWTSKAIVALAALTGIEVLLAVDNVVFITILVGKLPPYLQPKGLRFGLAISMVSRLLLLLPLGWVMKLDELELFAVLGHSITGRKLVLLLGGLFLIAKATYEIHDKLEGQTGHDADVRARPASFASIMMQIVPLNMVFSVDSVITAIGLTKEIQQRSFMAAVVIMVVAIAVATVVMLAFAAAIGSFVERHPTTKMLALSFLVLIGVVLMADGLDYHIPSGLVYFTMAFSMTVEMLNIRARKRYDPVKLHQTHVDEPAVEL